MTPSGNADAGDPVGAELGAPDELGGAFAPAVWVALAVAEPWAPDDASPHALSEGIVKKTIEATTREDLDIGDSWGRAGPERVARCPSTIVDFEAAFILSDNRS
jgi:hypothetical protein